MTNKTNITPQLVKIYPLVEQEYSLKITSPEDVEIATEILSQLNKINDSIEEEKQKVLAPLNKARLAEINRWKPAITLYDKAITSLRSKLSVYQTNATNEALEAQEAISKRIGTGKGSLKLETAVKKLQDLPTPATEISTRTGTLTFREKVVLDIISVKLIPLTYWKIDEDMILKDLKENKMVPGARLKTIQVPVNER